MLRDSHSSWWRRFLAPEPVFATVESARPERRCPDCRTLYDVRDRYCPGCHVATPEWRYG
jgi:hypothetical protein